MEKFEVGKVYFCRSACDYNCVWSFGILARTDKSVTIYNPMQKVNERKKIMVHDGAEFIYPLGKYSMAPILRATKETASPARETASAAK